MFRLRYCSILLFQPFFFHLSPETFHRGIVPAITFPAHAAEISVSIYESPVIVGRIGRTSVGVEDTSGENTSPDEHILKGIHDKEPEIGRAHV